MHLQLHPRYTHFPYTTLFRSSGGSCWPRCESGPSPPAPLPRVGEGSKAKTFLAVHPSTACGRGAGGEGLSGTMRSEEHTSELQSQSNLVCRYLLEKKKKDVCE